MIDWNDCKCLVVEHIFLSLFFFFIVTIFIRKNFYSRNNDDNIERELKKFYRPSLHQLLLI